MPRLNTSNIILIGFMGSGKTTIGLQLAREFNKKHCDTDNLIEVISGKSIPDLFKVSEPYFRGWEKEVCRGLHKKHNHIISTGGGIVLAKENHHFLKRAGTIIFLKANGEAIIERLKDCKKRPLLQRDDKEAVIKSLLKERTPFYESLADKEIDTSNLNKKQVVEAIRSFYTNTP